MIIAFFKASTTENVSHSSLKNSVGHATLFLKTMFCILHGIATLPLGARQGGARVEISGYTYHSVTIFPNDLTSKENLT